MRVLNVYPLDTVFEIELRRSDAQKIVKALDLAKIEYDGNNLEEKESVQYVNEVLYPTLVRLIEETKHGNG